MPEINPKTISDGAGRIGQDVLQDVQVKVEARLGRATLTIRDLVALEPGGIVKLETNVAEDIDLYLNGAVVARGEIVAVDDYFAVRITQIISE